MKSVPAAVAAIAATLAFAPSAPAQSPAERAALAEQIVQAREEAQGRGPLDASLKQFWTEQLARLPVAQLLSIAGAGPDVSLRQAIARTAAALQADAVSPDLGDSGADLVFTKVTPCRIVDTRQAGGPLGTASQRNFYVAGTSPSLFAPQGGLPCGVPFGATSVAVNLTVTGTAGPGWLRAWPYAGSGTASVINYATADTIANGLILPICDPASATCTRDLTVRADAAGAQVIIDVMGYFRHVNKDDYRAIVVTAVGAPSYLSIPTMPACVSYASVTLNAPGPGVIVVEAHATVEMLHNLGADDTVRWGIDDSAGGCSLGYGESGLASVPSAAPASYYYVSDGAIHKATVAAGNHTYYLIGTRDTGSNTHFVKGNIKAIFYPQ
ncbi:MAG: hypothetical protein H6Q10_3438 [Acidobacteria bacterium]|nr:hypothetical protein [Acidobacteriota bacterium]